jgi:hypothetical protein
MSRTAFKSRPVYRLVDVIILVSALAARELVEAQATQINAGTHEDFKSN